MAVLDRIHTTDTATALRVGMLVLAALLVLLATLAPSRAADPTRGAR